MLNRIEVITIPKNKIIIENLFSGEVLLIRNNIYPIKISTSAHNTLTNGWEGPKKGGFAKGVGKKSPEMPWMKWGTAWVNETPEKKAAR